MNIIAYFQQQKTNSSIDDTDSEES